MVAYASVRKADPLVEGIGRVVTSKMKSVSAEGMNLEGTFTLLGGGESDDFKETRSRGELDLSKIKTRMLETPKSEDCTGLVEPVRIEKAVVLGARVGVGRHGDSTLSVDAQELCETSSRNLKH